MILSRRQSPLRGSQPLLALLLVLGAGRALAGTLELHTDRHSPQDLMVRGGLTGLAAGTDAFVRWADLRALPTQQLHLAAEFFPGEQQVTVVFLEDLLKALPVAPGTDTVLATCSDGYASVYRFDFIGRFRPFLILEINGLGPDKWPPPGLSFNPAPYVISVSARVVPAVTELLDPGHKKPWAVTTLEFASFAEKFHDAYAGKWARLSARAEVGRTIWVDSCASCHPGPGATFGGTKSGQPFLVLQTLAQGTPDFFRSYVRHPKEVNPSARMEGHPHYHDDQLDALLAFVTAETAK
jgi:mono/diheme cytochrome c family protein